MKIKKLPPCTNGHKFGDWLIDEMDRHNGSSNNLIKRCKKCPQTMRVDEFMRIKKEMEPERKRRQEFIKEIAKEHLDLFIC